MFERVGHPGNTWSSLHTKASAEAIVYFVTDLAAEVWDILVKNP